ncbi:tetratricopeptide repeat protein [Myxococcota bacterium]|nr:tetratricopeptide repeat protein [Myxococcota bacterium]MBU1432337.1 tetratricopeptide repeat protein [Myxococcota bacterium]MBU1898746.1 tetratricopeptide repeat protein [Myxococcota bacterium]
MITRSPALFASLALVVGCGGVSQEVMDRRLDAVNSKLAALEEVNQANLSRLEGLTDRLDLLSDKLEAQAVAYARRTPPAHIPLLKLSPPPEPEETGPVPTMTQEDLEPRLAAPRVGPRRAVPPPDNAAHAGNIGVVPLPISAPKAPPVALDEAIALFKKAQAEERAGALSSAIGLYGDFLKRFPDHSYADNALLREGQCRFARAEFAGALRSFKGVVEGYPTGNKVPDALLMIGLTQKKMGQARKGRDTLTRLMAMYPETKAARDAATALQQSADRM